MFGAVSIAKTLLTAARNPIGNVAPNLDLSAMAAGNRMILQVLVAFERGRAGKAGVIRAGLADVDVPTTDTVLQLTFHSNLFYSSQDHQKNEEQEMMLQSTHHLHR